MATATQKEKNALLVPLNQLSEQPQKRWQTQITPLDRLLGGGIVPGSLLLLGGEPGIGKSTLTLQIAERLAEEGTIIYASGEESPNQIAARAHRLGVKNDAIFLYGGTNIDAICATAQQKKAKIVIIDSIQIATKETCLSAPGSPNQLREVTACALQKAKSTQTTYLLIGHVTKGGEIAGPKLLEHMVDTVLYFDGEKGNPFRLLRVTKNRFGATGELAFFEMTHKGLIPLPNPSAFLIKERLPDQSGSVISVALEGTQPTLIEIQALVVSTHYSQPARRASGIDVNRLLLLLAILEKRGKVQLGNCDVFVSITGGLRIQDTGIDLAILLAIVSSFLKKPLPQQIVALGEVGLSGEVRTVTRAKERLKEAYLHGFHQAIHAKNTPKSAPMQQYPIDFIDKAWPILFS